MRRHRVADLSHWDWANDFTASEAAALFLGIEPTDQESARYRIEPILARMTIAHETARDWYKNKISEAWPEEEFNVGEMLVSTGMKRRRDDDSNTENSFFEWLAGKHANIELQRFDRNELSLWVKKIQMKSLYRFQTDDAGEIETKDTGDQFELPLELDTANIAFRAVFNGYGDESKTFKNRLIDYLKNYTFKFTAEAINRIATVANPHREPGRRKREPQ
jgi:hypothetical protein